MVTLISEQLQNQRLDSHTYHRALSLNLTTPEPCHPEICWSTYGLMPESSFWQLCPASKSSLQGVLSSSFPPNPVPLGPSATSLPEGGGLHRPLVPRAPVTDLPLPAAPPPPPKRHCRSLSVPEDLSHCRYTWRPSASKVWTPVKRRCHSGGCAGGSSLNSSLHSSSSPTFCSLAVSPDSPLPWSFPWDPTDPAGGGGGSGGSYCCFSPFPYSSRSGLQAPSPAQRRFSLSPEHILEAASRFLPPPSAPPHPTAPAAPVPLSSSSACSTPSLLRRVTPPQYPRCHSQPCDLLLRKPGLKRRRDQGPLPCARPELDFSKMTQTRSSDPLRFLEQGRLGCGGDVFMGLEPFWGDFHGSISPAEGLGRTSIGPLSESDEEEEEKKSVHEEGQQSVFERDCTELDLTLIEEN